MTLNYFNSISLPWFPCMRFKAYLQCRYGCLMHELQLLLQQVQQLLFGMIILLGPAVAALLMMLVLAYGMFYRPDLPPSQAILLAWSLLCGQSLLLWLYRDALLGSRYQLFLNSLPIPTTQRRLVDQLLLLACHPLLLLHLFIIASANMSQWQQVVPQLCFAVLQYGFAVALLYRGIRVLWLLLLSLPLLWLPTLPLALWGLSIALLCCWPKALPTVKKNDTPSAPKAVQGRFQAACRFWWQQSLQQPAALLSRLLLMLLILALGHISVTERPDLGGWIGLIAASLLLLNSAGWQVSQYQFCQHYTLFLAQFPPLLRQLQYCGPLMLTLLSCTASHYFFAPSLPTIVLFPCLLLSFIAASLRPTFLIPAWLIGAILSGIWLRYLEF